MIPHPRPLGIQNAIVGRVPEAAGGCHHVLAEDSLELRSDPEHRVARLLVQGVCLELDTDAVPHLESMAQHEELGLAVHPCPLK